MWSWRTAPSDGRAVAEWWTRGHQQWKQLRFGWRVACLLAVAAGALVAGSIAVGFTAAGLALSNAGGVPGATAVLDAQSSWFPPGTRYTVVLDGRPQDVLQPWHSAGGEALLVAAVTGLLAGSALAVAVIATLAAFQRPRR